MITVVATYYRCCHVHRVLIFVSVIAVSNGNKFLMRLNF
jgi:hypothetical protein